MDAIRLQIREVKFQKSNAAKLSVNRCASIYPVGSVCLDLGAGHVIDDLRSNL